MAPNVFDYIRNCIHRGREDHSVEQNKLNSDYHSYYAGETSQKYSYWKDASTNSNASDKFSEKSSYTQYMPSSEIARTCVHTPPNKDAREVLDYEIGLKS